MARYLTTTIGLALLAATLIWFVLEEPAILKSPGSSTSARESEPSGWYPELPTGVEVDDLQQPGDQLGCIVVPDDNWIYTRVNAPPTLQRDMVRVLENSTDAEHLMVVALLKGPEPGGFTVTMLMEAAALEPTNPMIASQALYYCTRTTGCIGSVTDVEQALIAADKANAAAWVQVAISRMRRDNEAGALVAMREAVAAASVNDFFIEYVQVFDRALAASSDLEAFDRLFAAFSLSGTHDKFPSEIYKECKDRGAGSAEWNDVCLKLGERFEHDGRSISTQSLGMSLQAKMYELGGDTRAHEQTSQRKFQFLRDYIALQREGGRADELQDLALFHRYVEISATSGEMAATRFLAEEVRKRMPGLMAQVCPTP